MFSAGVGGAEHHLAGESGQATRSIPTAGRFELFEFGLGYAKVYKFTSNIVHRWIPCSLILLLCGKTREEYQLGAVKDKLRHSSHRRWFPPNWIQDHLAYALAFFTVSATSPGWFEAEGLPKNRKSAGLSAPRARALAKCNAFEY
jgi:hypothetical protein